MAIKKPIVLNSSGQLEQLQTGDSIGNPDLISQTNGNAGNIIIGQPVYCSGNDTVDKAKADAVGTVNVIGLVADTVVGTGAAAAIQTDGVLSALTTDWDAVTGGSGGLIRDTIYYLSASTVGKITSTAPVTAGQFVLQVGIAISTTELLIKIGNRIKL